VINFQEYPITLSGNVSRIVENALARIVEKSFEKILDIDPEADHFQNANSSSTTTDISVVKFS